MTTIILEGPIAELREREARWLSNIGDQTANFGEDGQKDRTRILRNANDLRDMFFMVVVIGEFNAGKSTFVNAMLGEEVLPMGITPTTEVIELIRYGKNKGAKPELREEGIIREWVHPNTGAPGVVIVDTPGTGSVFAKHERIAKEFLSRSDLVIFLLSAKRAFAQTEKLYLELARDYGKKILLVINQMDLLEKKELQEVQSFVKQQVSDLLHIEPPIFLISAKQALKGGARVGGLFSNSTADGSGMDTVRKYLLDAFQKTPPAKQKLLAQLDFGESLIKRYGTETQKRLDLVVDDERQAKQLREELEKQAETLSTQLETSMRELDRVFGQLRERGRKFIGDNMTLKGIRTSAGNKDEIRAKFETEVVGSTLQQINSISEDYVNAVVDSSRRYWQNIIDRLKKMEALLEAHIETPDASSYSDQRLALQEAIAIADKELKTYNENNLAERLNDVFAGNLSGFNLSLISVVGGIATVIGVAALPGSLGAAGAVALGAVTAPFILGGGVLAYGYWRKLQNDAYKELDERLETLKKSYRQALQDLTDRERSRLLQYGQRILAPVFSRLEVVAETYRKQNTALDALKKEGVELRTELDRIQIVTE